MNSNAAQYKHIELGLIFLYRSSEALKELHEKLLTANEKPDFETVWRNRLANNQR